MQDTSIFNDYYSQKSGKDITWHASLSFAYSPFSQDRQFVLSVLLNFPDAQGSQSEMESWSDAKTLLFELNFPAGQK